MNGSVLKKGLFALAIAVSLASCGNEKRTHFDIVNTLIGNGGSGLRSTFLYPGATYPFGMVQFTPTFKEPQTGFTALQLSGVGCYSLGQFRMLPHSGDITESPGYNFFGDRQNITDQQGHAGWYQCMVDGCIKTQLGVTQRSGMALLQPEGDKPVTILLGTGYEISNGDFGRGEGRITEDGHFECHAVAHDFCSAADTPFDIWYYGEFDRAPIASGAWKEDTLYPDAKQIEGRYSGLYLTFPAGELKYKFAISFVSLENAKENLRSENSGWDFGKVRSGAEKAWEKYLSLIDVEDTDSDRIEQFYTHLYHALIHPSLASDVNGEYMGSDLKVHKEEPGHNYYHMFSNWDTYRTQCQLLAMLAPDVASDIVRSHILFAKQHGGGLPHWAMANYETNVMPGDPGVLVCCNAWAFGAKDFDAAKLGKILFRSGEDPSLRSQNFPTREHLNDYLSIGYTWPSLTLEYNIADYAIAQFALNALGNKAKYEEYLERSHKWKNLLNPANGWIQGRNPDGSWEDVSAGWKGFAEASHKIYYWMIPHDMDAVMEATGGKKAGEARLDSLFVRLDDLYDGDYFSSCNQPGFGVPWTYNWTDSPWKTSQVINRILTEVYGSGMEGIPGNDDLGAMGSWYVFACMGLYPYLPGTGGFSVHTPIFEKITLHLPGGDVRIEGGDSSQDGHKHPSVNGKPVEGTWIPWDDISRGGTIRYE